MSLNDPQWGKRGSGGPPDLDEIWRNVNRRINELFGRKGGGGDPVPGGDGGGGNRAMIPLSGAGILIALVLVVWLASGFYIVDEGRRGVVTRFGKYTETTQPGARWHLPYPIEEKELADFSQVRTVEVGYRNTPKNKKENEALMLTDDENIIDIQFAVQYNLKNAEANVFNVRKPDLIVQFIAQTAMGEVVGKAKMDFVLYEGREQIAKSAEKLMQEMLDRYQTGVYVQKVTLQSVQPPDKVQAAFDDAVKAGQDRERFRNEGQAYANDVVPRARGNAARLIEEANGYQAEVIQRAEGDASRFRQIQVEYAKAPGVTRERLYLDMMQTVVGNSSKVLVDQKAGSSSLLYLPLDKLIQQSGPSAGTPATGGDPSAARQSTPPAAEPTVTLDPGRSREALRARDRGGDAR
jgi:membrane protease subunit HflK